MALVALVVDQDVSHNDALSELLDALGFDCVVCRTVEEVDQHSGDQGYDVAFLSLQDGGAGARAALQLRAVQQAQEIILMNEVDEPELVTRLIGKGATYFFCKPFDERFLRDLLTDVASELTADPNVEEADHCTIDQFGLIRGSSKPMLKLYRTMRKVAQTDTSVLVTGESGSGKELVVQTLHMFSNRAERELVAMNCATIPKELFESELFGHEKGSFSGAVSQHRGYFERAHQGTLFLDELTEMPIDLQAKLLRVLELGTFRRVGGEKELSSDVRIVAASNRDPEEAIAQNLLREDLYYRVSRFPIHIPPLRDRGGDRVGLARYFLNELNQEHDRRVVLEESAERRINEYDWPGNVRELQGAIERAFILADGAIEAHTLGELEGVATRQDYIKVPPTSSIDEVERQLIFAALEEFEQDKQRAADSLGISLKTLYNRLNSYEAS